jgi:hypothetical protein
VSKKQNKKLDNEQGLMIQSNKDKLELDWLKRHTLSPEQRKQLIKDKVARAIEQSNRLSKTIGKFSCVE